MSSVWSLFSRERYSGVERQYLLSRVRAGNALLLLCIAKHSCSSQTPTKGSESTPHVANPLVLCIARVLKQSPGPAKGREWSGLSISRGPRIIKYQIT